VCDLVAKMLTVDPEKRITLDRILEHRWCAMPGELSVRVRLLAQLGRSNRQLRP